MSKINEFINKLKQSRIPAMPERTVEIIEFKPEPAPNVEVKRKPHKSVYVAQRPHAKVQERNERFKEFIQSDEAKALIKNVKNSWRVGILVSAFKEKFNERMPLVSAYSIYNQTQI